MADGVVQRAGSIVDGLNSSIEGENMSEELRTQIRQLASELSRLPALYALVRTDQVCQIDAATQIPGLRYARTGRAAALIETRPVRAAEARLGEKALELASLLSATRSPLLPRCMGLRVGAGRLEYLYEPPAALLADFSLDVPLRSVSECLDQPDGPFVHDRRRPAHLRLYKRVRFAHAIARALGELHAVGRAHGGLCAGNVWFAAGGEFASARISAPLLVGFGLGSGAAALEEAKVADIRALGVLLVEIGLGEVVAAPALASGAVVDDDDEEEFVASAEWLARRMYGVMGKEYTDVALAALRPRNLSALFASSGEDVLVGLDRAFRGVVVDPLLGVFESRV